MTVEIKIHGIEETQEFLKKKQRTINGGINEGLRNASLFMVGEVKMSIAGKRAEKKSVDTGRFLNSVSQEVRKDHAIVFSNVEYAKFLEFGTSKMKPRSHFRNSLFRNKAKVREIIDNELKKGLDK